MSKQAYEALGALHTQAQLELSATTGTVGALMNKLREGVSYEEAIEIIERFWEPREAQSMKLQLFTSFPQRNGELIMYKGLDDKLSKAINVETTRQFFVQASSLLQAQVSLILSAVNSQPLECAATVDTINNVRKQLAKFVGYMGWGAYEIRSQLLSSGPKSWESLPTEVKIIDDGDYLFLESLEGVINDSIKTFVERDLPSKWDMTLTSVDFRFGTIEAVMEMIMLFAEYVCDYPLPGNTTE